MYLKFNTAANILNNVPTSFPNRFAFIFLKTARHSSKRAASRGADACSLYNSGRMISMALEKMYSHSLVYPRFTLEF